jgi:hypothetical protein
LSSGGRGIDGIAGSLQAAGKKVRDAFFVLDDQNPHPFKVTPAGNS